MLPRVLALLLLAAAARAQSIAEEYGRTEREAFDRYNAKDYPGAIAGFEKQMALFAENPRPYYNIACCWALAGDGERAATWLKLAILRGWRDLDHTLADPDFSGVKDAPAFAGVVRDLRVAVASDPDPLPRDLDFATAGPARTATEIAAAFRREEAALETIEPLLEEGQVRRRLFPILDRKSAAFGRYLVENGDARDADVAAYARVETAWSYLERADAGEGDAALRTAAARMVARRAEEFLRGWAGSPYLADVLHVRTLAARGAGLVPVPEAIAQWRRIAADFADSAAAWRALVELCVLEADAGDRDALRRDLDLLRGRWSRDPAALASCQARLFKARLLVDGAPELEGAAPPEGTKAALYAFVSPGHDGSERRLAVAKVLLEAHGAHGFAVIAVSPQPIDSWRPWLAEHAGPAALGATVPVERLGELWLAQFPTLVLARGREVLAVDPPDETLGKLVADACPAPPPPPEPSPAPPPAPPPEAPPK